MEYNKSEFLKASDHKILHKVKKQWVVVSLAMLALLGGGAAAEHVSANADTTNKQPLKAQINHNLQQEQQANAQSQAPNVNNQPRQTTVTPTNLTRQAEVLHDRILKNAALLNTQPDSANRSVNGQEDHQISAPAAGHPQRQSVHQQIQSPASQVSQSSNQTIQPPVYHVGSGINYTGTYDGLNYIYDPVSKRLEFTSGKLTWNNGANWGNYGTQQFIGNNDENSAEPYGQDAPQFMNQAKYIKFDNGVDTTDQYRGAGEIGNLARMIADDSNVETLDLGNNFTYAGAKKWASYIYNATFASDANLRTVILSPSFNNGIDTNQGKIFASDPNLKNIVIKPDSGNHNGGENDYTQLSGLGIPIQNWYRHDYNGNVTQVNASSGNATPGLYTRDQTGDDTAGTYDGLNYIYDPSSKTVTFLSGTVQGNSMSNFVNNDPTLAKAENIVFDSGINTSNVKSFDWAFARDNNVKSIDLGSDFTDHAGGGVSLKHVFQSDKNLQWVALSPDFANWDNKTSNVFSNDSLLYQVMVRPSKNSSFGGTRYGGSSYGNTLGFQNGNNWKSYNGEVIGSGSGNLVDPGVYKNADYGEYDGIIYKVEDHKSTIEFIGGAPDGSNSASGFDYFIPRAPSIIQKAHTLTFDSDIKDIGSMDSMIANDSDVNVLNLNLDPSGVTDMSNSLAFDQQLRQINFGGKWNTRGVRSMSNMFKDEYALKSLDLSSFDTSDVTDMSYMFVNCTKLNHIDFGDHFDTANVSNMSYMFGNSDAISDLVLPSSFDTRKAYNNKKMTSMFESDAGHAGSNPNSGKLKFITIQSPNTMFTSDSNNGAFRWETNQFYRVTSDWTHNKPAQNITGSNNHVGTWSINPLPEPDKIVYQDIFDNDGLGDQLNGQSHLIYGSAGSDYTWKASDFPTHWLPVNDQGIVQKKAGFTVNGKGQHVILVAPAYDGLVYKYDPHEHSVEFISGTLNWNQNAGNSGNDGTHNFLGTNATEPSDQYGQQLPNYLYNARIVTFDDAVNFSQTVKNGNNIRYMFANDPNVRKIDLGANFMQEIASQTGSLPMDDLFRSDTNLRELDLPGSFGNPSGWNTSRNAFLSDKNLERLVLRKGLAKGGPFWNGAIFSSSDALPQRTQWHEMKSLALNAASDGNVKNLTGEIYVNAPTAYELHPNTAPVNWHDEFSEGTAHVSFDTTHDVINVTANGDSDTLSDSTHDSLKTFANSIMDDKTGNLLPSDILPNNNKDWTIRIHKGVKAPHSMFFAFDGQSEAKNNAGFIGSKTNFIGNQVQNIDLRGLDASQASDAEGMFINNTVLRNIEVGDQTSDTFGRTSGNIKNWYMAFGSDTGLTKLDLHRMDMNQAQITQDMFDGDTALQSLTLGSSADAANNRFRLSHDWDMAAMFSSDKNLTQIPGLSDALSGCSAVTTMRRMFGTDPQLVTVTLPSDFDTSHVTDMDELFEGDGALKHFYIHRPKHHDAAHFSTQNVKYMNFMFQGAQLSDQDLNNVLQTFDTSSLKNAWFMFGNDSALKKLTLPDSFSTKNVSDMHQMFESDTNLQQLTLPADFDTTKAMTGMTETYGLPGHPGEQTETDPIKLFNPHNRNTKSGTGLSELFQGDSKLTTLKIQSPQTKFNSDNYSPDGSSRLSELGLPEPWAPVQNPDHSSDQWYTKINGNSVETDRLNDDQPHVGTWVRNPRVYVTVKYRYQGSTIGQTTFWSSDVQPPRTLSNSDLNDINTGLPASDQYHLVNPGEKVSYQNNSQPVQIAPDVSHNYEKVVYYYENHSHVENKGVSATPFTGKSNATHQFKPGQQSDNGASGLKPGWQVQSAQTMDYSDGTTYVEVVPLHQSDDVVFELSGSNIPAGWTGPTGVISDDQSDYSGNDYQAGDAGDNTFTANDSMKGLPQNYIVMNVKNNDTNYDGKTHYVEIKPVANPATITYYDAETNTSVGTSQFNLYPAVDGNRKSLTKFALERLAGFPSGYETYPVNQAKFSISKGTNTIDVAPQHVIAYGNWDLNNSHSARFTLTSDGNGQNTLTIDSNGPMNTNSWSQAGYTDDSGKHYVFSDSDGTSRDQNGSDTLPNALNRNSVQHLVLNGAQLPSDSSELFHNMHNLVDVTGTPDASKVTSMSDMFASDDNPNFKHLDLTGWNVSKVTDMSDLFAGDTHLSDLTLSQTSTPNLSDMDSMFMSDRSLHGNSKSDTNANNHTSASDIHNLNALDTSHVSDMSDVFASDPNLQGLDLHSWQTSDVTSFNGMFAKDPDLTFLDIQSMTTPQTSIASSDQMFESDFSDSNQMKNQQYAIVMNKDFRVGKASNLDGYWASPDYKSDLELFSPRQLDLYGAGLGPNQSATWIKKSSQPSQLQRQPVVFYNQVSDQVNNPVVQYLYDPNGADGKSNGLPSISDQINHLIVPSGYRLPHIIKGNPEDSEILDRLNEHIITNYGTAYQNQPIRINLLGDSDHENLQVPVYYNSASQGTKEIPVSGYYGDSDDSVADDQWYQNGTSGVQGPAQGYTLDPEVTKYDENGRLHFNLKNSAYQANHNAQWQKGNNGSETPQLYYDQTQAQLNIVYLNQIGAQVGYTDHINGRSGDQVSISGNGREGIPSGYRLASDQDTNYDLQTGPHTVYLHVIGNPSSKPKVKVYLILQGRGTNQMVSDLYTLKDQQVGDVDEIDPNDAQFAGQVNGYSINASDQPQYVTVGSNGTVPQSIFFKYHQLGANDQSSLTVHYITESDREVGSGVITGKIGTTMNPITGSQQVILPAGYHTSNNQDSYSYTLSEAPQDVYILVDGNQSSPQLTIHKIKYNRNGVKSESDQVKTYSNVSVGSSDYVSPYSYKPSSDYHVDPGDQAYHVTVLPNGKLSQNNVTFTYHENYQPTKIGTVDIHYYTGNKGDDTYHEIDSVQDHGLVGDPFVIRPYLNDLPDGLDNNYQLATNPLSTDFATPPVNNVAHYETGDKNVYIKITPVSVS